MEQGHAHAHGHDHDHDHSHGHGHGSDESINLRGAIIHVLGDLIQSLGVAAAGALIWWKQVGPSRLIIDNAQVWCVMPDLLQPCDALVKRTEFIDWSLTG
jgi:hypothetical protein